MNIPRFLNLKEAATLLGGNGWLSELLEAVERRELKVTVSGYAQEWTDRIETADLRAYLVKHHGSDLLVEIEEALKQKPTSTVSEQKAVQVIAAMLAIWPSGIPLTGKDLEKAAQSVGVSISDDTIRKVLKEARAIAPKLPPA